MISWVSRTLSVYEDLCAISVRPHQYSLIVYLFLGQAGFAVDDFQELRGTLAKDMSPSALDRETDSVRDAVCESHKVNVVVGALPVRVEGQHQPERGCLRVCMIV